MTLTAATALVLALGGGALAAPASGAPLREVSIHLAATRPVAPPVNAAVDYQLGGGYAPLAGTAVVTRDMYERPARGTYAICYVNAFQTQPGTRSWWLTHHPSLVLRTSTGTPVVDPGWPDEMLLDTSTAAKRAQLVGLATAWIDRCARSGFRAVEPDNLDSWTRSGRRLTMSENAAYAAGLVRAAHARGLAVAQKNDADMLALRSRTGFDFAVVEECQVYSECDAYLRVYGRHVIEIEYADAGGRANFRSACAARGSRISIVYRDRELVPRGQPGYVYARC